MRKFIKVNAVVLIVTLGFIFGATANAQEQEKGQELEQEQRGDRKERPTFEQLLEKMDTKKDGKLSAKEVKGPLKDSFEKLDVNKDGFITKKEFENAPKPKRRKSKKESNKD